MTKALKIRILAVGSELLTPHYQDTNSLYITKRLNDLGLDVQTKSIVGDEWDDLLASIQEALSKADIIIVIGGLGPTQDDRTREAFAAALDRKLVFNRALFRNIEERFRRRQMSMPAVNKKQAYVIAGAEVLENSNGTAPGLWIESNSKLIILLPGPPQELKPMFESAVWPRLQNLQTGFSARATLKITGLAESSVETLISDLYSKSRTLKLTTLAYPGQIEIHLTGYSEKDLSEAEKRVSRTAKSISDRLGDNVFSTSGEELEEIVGLLLRQNRETLAVAESCTGGLLAHRITNISGSSDYFLQGAVAYSNEAKTQLLDVSPALIIKHGAVSSAVARAMALGIRNKAQTSFGLAITGIAGPAGGTAEKPAGLVYIALAKEKGLEVTRNQFLGPRESIKFQSSQKALDMLRRHLLKLMTQNSQLECV